MKTKIYTVAILVFTSIFLSGQSPNWQWANRAGGNVSDYGRSVANDLSGNVIVIGDFRTALVPFGTTTLTNTGSSTYDIFVAKYNASGNVLWAKSFGGVDSDFGHAVSTDASGNIYVGGYFNSATMTIGTGTLTNAGTGNRDFFIVKFDPSGNVLWARSAGGTASDQIYGVATDPSGNVCVSGHFASSSFVIGTTTLTNAGTSNDIFIAKYDGAGNNLWARSAGTSLVDANSGIAVDGTGNIYITGDFQGSGLAFGTSTLTGSGSGDVYIAKYDPSGNAVWGRSAGGSGGDKGYGITADAGGNAYITGYFSGATITFGTNTFTNTTTNVLEVFIAKYDAAGNVLWARTAGGTAAEQGNAVFATAGGNVLLTGNFQSASLAFGSTTITPAGFGYDIFVAKYDGSGNLLWAKSAGGNNFDTGYDISASSNEEAYITGSFSSTSLAFGASTLTVAGNDDMFVAKLDSALSTGITKFDSDLGSFIIYPNPSTGKFTLKFEEDLNGAQIYVIDAMGKEIAKQEINEMNEVQMNIEAKGFYFIKIQTEKGSSVKKIIVQ
jgi:hypothetical protein